ncbi:MAG TPA: cysteine rich repeat-containing protein [Nitrospiraceae bacterium]|nr:cysteine rich repeat-containing protein [Nitrospiraceae bacterium]
MAQQQFSSGTIAGAITIIGLGLVWVTVATNFPSQEELSSASLPAEVRQAARPSSSLSVPPTLDFTIPTSPSLPAEAVRSMPDDDRARNHDVEVPVVTRFDSRALQAAKLKCEADIEQLCPGSPDGSTRTRCLQQRAKQLPPLCQNQLREQFVKWKEDRNRLMEACDEDVKRFCRAVQSGSGQILQCLQSHGQEVSDRCYHALRKGMFFFK